MINLYDILPNIEVSKEDVARAEVYAKQYLEALYPDQDMRKGTAIRDMAIRPNASLLALVNKGVEYFFENYTLADVTDESPEDVVDKIFSNMLVYRNEGTFAQISARLYFSTRKTVVIPSGTFFSVDNENKFYPTESLSIPANDLEYSPIDDEYFIDVLLRSEGVGPQYNIEEGSLLYFTNFDAYFLRGEISYLVSSSTAKETNTELLSRAQTSISTRNLINTPSIAYNIETNFPATKKVLTVGMGHPEMLRDKRTLQVGDSDTRIDAHLGGFTDVYVYTAIVDELIQMTTDAEGNATLTGPYISLELSSINGGEQENDIAVTTPFVLNVEGYDSAGNLLDHEKDLGFSAKQTFTMKFGGFYANKVLTLSTKKFQSVSSMQTYVESSANRVSCANMLIRGLEPYLLDITVNSYSAAPDEELVKKVAIEYVDTLAPGEPFIVADFIDKLYDTGEMSSLSLPLSISYDFKNKNYTNEVGNVVDRLEPVRETAHFVINSITTGTV